MQRKYSVSYTCIFTVDVVAESPAEAADLAESECPIACQIDGPAFVWRTKDDDPRIAIEWDENYQILPDTDDGDE